LRPEHDNTGYEEADSRGTADEKSHPPSSLNAQKTDYARGHQNEGSDER
jgi:hypothetical protein